MWKLFLDCLLLKRAAYEHVEEYKHFTMYAVGVVVVTSITGAFRQSEIGGLGFSWVGVVMSFTYWLVLTGIVFAVGSTILKSKETNATFGQVARTLGFAQLPGVFYIVALISPIVAVIVLVWQAYASVLAIQAALDYPKKLKAFGVFMIGFITSLVVVSFIFASIGLL